MKSEHLPQVDRLIITLSILMLRNWILQTAMRSTIVYNNTPSIARRIHNVDKAEDDIETA